MTMTQVKLSELKEQVEQDKELDIDEVVEIFEEYFDTVDDFDEKVELINKLRDSIHEVSPFEEPVDKIQWVPQEDVEGNDYNPNEVATPEMELLHKSIKEDGYTQPIVTYELEDKYEVVDGYHRTLIGKEKEDIKERLNEFVPVTIIDKPKDERISSTIRHNRARGTHQIRDMSDIVVQLTEAGWSEQRIKEELGMELDEVIRLKQVSGLKEAFSGHEFSQSWTEYEEKQNEEE